MTVKRHLLKGELFLLFCLCIIQIALLGYVFTSSTASADEAPAIAPPVFTGPKLLIVAAPRPERMPSHLSPYGPGFEQELLGDFAQRRGYRIQWLNVATRSEGLRAVLEKRADLLAGFGGDLPADLRDYFVQGRSYAHFRPVVVYQPEQSASEALKTREAQALLLDVTGFKSHSLDEPRARLVDPAAYALLLSAENGLRTGRTLNRSLSYHWFWRKSDVELNHDLQLFWADESLNETILEMTERYYGFLPKKPRQADILDLAKAMDERIAPYAEAINKAAAASGLDPLFLTAVIYQESRFDPKAQSRTGVRGIMQLTTDTARMLKVDRTNPGQCIMGGAKYLRAIWDGLEDEDLTEWDRWFLALAAFNQGPGNLQAAMRYSEKQGDGGKTWRELKDVYPQISRLYNCRGREAVDFVESVRYYYYILTGLASIARPEMQNFTGLFSLIPLGD